MTDAKEIYNLFTLKNNIKLSKEALQLLKSTELDINDIIKEYKQMSSTSLLDINALNDIIYKNCKIVYKKYEYFSLLAQFKILRSRYSDLTDIKQIDKSPVYIFGYVYTDKNDTKVIEDPTGIIKIEGTPYKNIFLHLKGCKKGDVFVVTGCTNNEKQVYKHSDMQIKNKSNIAFTSTEKYPNFSIKNVPCEKSSFFTVNVESKNPYEIKDSWPRILNINIFKICILNKAVITDIKDIPVYLECHNFNFTTDYDFFYEETFNLFIISSSINLIYKYQDIVFIMLKTGSELIVKESNITITE